MNLKTFMLALTHLDFYGLLVFYWPRRRNSKTTRSQESVEAVAMKNRCIDMQ